MIVQWFGIVCILLRIRVRRMGRHCDCVLLSSVLGAWVT